MKNFSLLRYFVCDTVASVKKKRQEALNCMVPLHLLLRTKETQTEGFQTGDLNKCSEWERNRENSEI